MLSLIACEVLLSPHDDEDRSATTAGSVYIILEHIISLVYNPIGNVNNFKTVLTISFSVGILITHIIKVYLISIFQHACSNSILDSPWKLFFTSLVSIEFSCYLKNCTWKQKFGGGGKI